VTVRGGKGDKCLRGTVRLGKEKKVRVEHSSDRIETNNKNQRREGKRVTNGRGGAYILCPTGFQSTTVRA